MVWADARFLCKEETSLDDNRAMRAESGVGTLPNGCCAPLAFPYVPVQKNDPSAILNRTRSRPVRCFRG